MSNLVLELRYALRMLKNRPGFATIAVVTLALGIGATTAIYSVVDTLIVRDLPYPEPDRIVTIWQDNQRDGIPRDDVAPANFLDWRGRSTAFERMAAADPYSLDLVGPDHAEVLFATQVTEGFFDILKVQPYLGRLFLPADHTPGTGPVIVLGHALWQGRFGADSSIVGQVLTLDDAPTEVVGVLPPQFDVALVNHDSGRDVWIPRQMESWEQQTRGSSWWNVIARLAPGVTLEQAEADLDRVAEMLAAEYPQTNSQVGTTVVPLHEHLVGPAGRTLWLLLGAVTLVLLIACANVAGLLLARGAEREAELSVRAALGAGPGRLARLVFMEAVVLAGLGAVLGLLVAFLGVDLLKVLAPGQMIARLREVTVDGRVLAFTLGVSSLTAVLFGSVPALQSVRPDLQAALKENRGTAGHRRTRARNALIAAETAFALALLIGAGLLLRSFVSLLNEDPGFRRDHLAVVQIFRWANDETASERTAFFREAIERMQALPGVLAAGAVSAAPFLEANIDIRQNLYVQGEAPARAEEQPQTYLTFATPGYFQTVGVRLVQGRLLTRADEDQQAELVAVINETMRRRFWRNVDPMGRSIRLGADTAQPVRIVGVVGDVRHEGFDATPRPEVFVPHGRGAVGPHGRGVFGSMTIFLRTAIPPGGVVEPAKRVLWELDPRQTIYHTTTVDQMVSRVVAPQRFVLVLLGAFAALALIMAAVGIYGLVSFAVQRRTHEVGIRMALGAQGIDVIRLIVRQGVAVAGIGVAVGLTLALGAAGVLGSFLYNVPSRDAVTFVVAAAVLLGVAAGASYLPARRAARVDPMEALRHE